MSEHPQEHASATSLEALSGVGREAIRARLEGRAASSVNAEGALARAAAVFVTLRIDGALRGCIGSLVALHGDLVAEVEDRACAAAFDDPRFPTLTAAELDRTSVEISILGELEPVASRDELDPAIFGIEVSDGSGRRAVLLPGIPSVETVEEQIKVTRQKAGIPPGNELKLRRFEVVKVPDPDFNDE